MDQQAWVMFFVGLALAASLVALGVVAYPWLKRQRQGYPLEAAIEAALLPVIFEGICAAYRLSERSVDELHQRMQGLDKHQIAVSIYGLLPDQVGSFELTLVKRVVTRERFEQLVQNVFDRFDRSFVQYQAHFDEMFQKWSAENQSPLPVPQPSETPAH